MNEKILIIENQITQFKMISEHLKTNGYHPIPSPEEYTGFLDYVRIQINPQYGETYKTECFNKIMEYITAQSPDLIIMDHILGGSCKCETGIGLALKLCKPIPIPIPVLFLSRTEHTEKNRVEEYEKFRNQQPGISEWTHKGYFGDGILEENYFKSHVIPSVERLLPKKKHTMMHTYIDTLTILNFYWPTHKSMLIELQKRLNDLSEIPDELWNMIKAHATNKNTNFNRSEIEILEQYTKK